MSRRSADEGALAEAGALPLRQTLLRPFDSLRIREYRIFWISMAATFSAMQMQMLARTWFMYDLTNSAILLGASGAAAGIPMLCFSLVGGAMADRVDKRILLLTGQAMAILAALIVGTVIFMNAIAWWHLILASVLQGLVIAIMMPARQSIIPELVEERQLLNAISLSAAEMNLTRIVAPAFAGFLVAAVGISVVYFVMAGFYTLSFLLMLGLPPHKSTPREDRRPVTRDIREAVQYIRRSSIIVSLLVIAFITVIFGMPFQLLLPIFTEDILKVGPQGLGWLLSLAGVGALIGSIITASLGDYKRKGVLLIVLTIVYGLSIVSFTLSRNFIISLALMIPLGLGQSGRMTINNTLVQVNVEHYMRGRVMSVYMMTMGLQPLGVMPISAAAAVFGAPLALGFAGFLVALYALWVGIFQRTIRKLE